MNPKVTVGLPFYNNQSTLADAIRSVLNQSHTNLELLIVNDGSKDDYLRVLKLFDDPRIRIVDDGTNRGLAARLNQIANLAKTEFLFRMDADDIMHPDRVSLQVARLQAPDSPDLVSASAWAIDVSNNLLGGYGIGMPGPSSVKDLLLGRGSIIHPTVAGKVEWFRANPYSEDLRRSEDAELWLRTFDHTNSVRLAEPVLYYRQSAFVSMRNYRIAKREGRRRRAKYGPDLVGYPATLRLQVRAVLRDLIVEALNGLGLSNLVMNRRVEELSDQERSIAEMGLEAAVLTHHRSS